jgi:hypothetical protein
MESKYIEATRAAQGLMSSVIKDLKIDGHWGSYTESVYQKVPVSTQMAVRAALSTFATDPKQLANEFAKDKSDGGLDKVRALKERNAVMRPDVQSAIANAAMITGVNSSLLLGFAKLESNLNPSASNPDFEKKPDFYSKYPRGGSRGLMQMQDAAWTESAALLKKRFGVIIGDFTTSWDDPTANALAGAAYLKINSERLVRYGYLGPLTPAILYLAHQQGAGGFIELWRISQGRKVVTNYVTPVAMKGNPPADGQGVTTDKKEFFLRWLAVAEKRIT